MTHNQIISCAKVSHSAIPGMANGDTVVQQPHDGCVAGL